MPKPKGHPRLDDDIYQEIDEVFVRLVTEKAGTHPTAVEVRGELKIHRSTGRKKASESAVRRHVRLLKEEYPDQGGRPYIPEIWTPNWDKKSPEEIALLLGLHRLKLRAQLWTGQDSGPVGLYEHEAKWAVRIHPSLEGSHEMVELLMTLWYGEREVFAHYRQEDVYVDDLNDVLTWKPWFGGRYFRDYEDVTAHQGGIATHPRVTYQTSPGANPQVSLSGLDALLFAFCAVINAPSLIRCAVSSVAGQQGTKPSPSQESRLALDAEDSGSPFPSGAVFGHMLEDEPSPPALAFLLDRRFDSGREESILEELSFEDKKVLAGQIADVHGLPEVDRIYDLPHLKKV